MFSEVEVTSGFGSILRFFNFSSYFYDNDILISHIGIENTKTMIKSSKNKFIFEIISSYGLFSKSRRSQSPCISFIFLFVIFN